MMRLRRTEGSRDVELPLFDGTSIVHPKRENYFSVLVFVRARSSDTVKFQCQTIFLWGKKINHRSAPIFERFRIEQISRDIS
jgi:HJR/Mrr/RecB family endonuclease